jgi:hypothetical protein
MPQVDKDAYLRIHNRLEEILHNALDRFPDTASFGGDTTLGFNPSSGVRSNRPKDLWCALYPKDAAVIMPQIFLIVSHRGIELGYAAAIHPSDFTNPAFRNAVRANAPKIIDSLPDETSPIIEALSQELRDQGGWYFRRKVRLTPKENDFTDLRVLVSYLKTSEGKAWGAGAVSRYWLPHEFTSDIDLGEELTNAINLFRPLMVKPGATPEPPRPKPISVDADGIRADLERFMELYPERRSRPFGTDPELWELLGGLRQRIKAIPAVASKAATLQVSWSVGQGNWARVPWIALLDSRVTDSTQRGVYGVFLFREDMSGVYLTFNQGVTEPKRRHGAAAGLQLLRENAEALRVTSRELGPSGFNLDSEIDLRTEGTLGQDYEAATIAYKFYERGAVQDNAVIVQDISALLDVYERYITESVPNEGPDEPRPIPPSPPYGMQQALDELFFDESELDELRTLWKTKKISYFRALQVSVRPS